MVAPLPIIYAPNPIFRQKAKAVDNVNDKVREVVAQMFATLEAEHAIGIGANMVGVLQRIVVIKLREDETRYALINPEIKWKSTETQKFIEASVCFPGIEAEITRPNAIKLSYLDEKGKSQELEAEGFLATVIQHEIDYLDGKIFVDYLSKMKRDMLLKKSEKFLKSNPPHIHGEHCSH